MDSRDFPLIPKTKKTLLKDLFDFDAQPDDEEGLNVPGDSYLSYYQKIVQNYKPQSITKTHGDIANLVGILKCQDATRSSVETSLRDQISEADDPEEILEDSVNLAVRLLLMMSTGGSLSCGRLIAISGETTLNWKEGTIKDLVKTQMAPQAYSTIETVKLEKTFNARNLERIAGIRVRWTSNLADHLRMREDDTAVEVFHYASFLRFHQSCSVFPPHFLDETRRTLSLLFPEYDKSTTAWFTTHVSKRQKLQELPLDPLARECGQLKSKERHIGNFEYWHDRLVILKQNFDEAEPEGAKRWWYDRRKRVQWYTFWIAVVVLILTVVFGVVQSVEGGLQVWLALHN